MGLIHWWARWAALAPAAVNAASTAPGLSQLVRRLAGIATERSLPRFAPRAYTSTTRSTRPGVDGRSVILWPDTFNNHFHPQVARAAEHVLEGAGFDVVVPRGNFCCGRPLYDYGMLELARHLLRRILRRFQREIRAGIPFVVLEPSCAAVFRDELVNLFPQDEDALRLSRQTHLLGEFLDSRAPHHQYQNIGGNAIVQVHCHQRALMGWDHDAALLERMGVKPDVLDSGCCGMAGSFGFEADHYQVSVQCAERVLLPALRASSEQTLIISDGFSCREQITQLTGRQPLHLAEVLERALPPT